MDESLTDEDRAALKASDARARLENSLELLRREWRDGCRAGMTYDIVLGNLQSLRENLTTVPTECSLGRSRIETQRYIRSERRHAYRLMQEEVAKGHQGFVVCPLAKEAVEEAERLRRDVFPDLRIATLHDRMKRWEQSAVITAFRGHQFDLLVTTSVIGVGSDIPNATVIVIENADRFGLAQLHQLRGRVGRGGTRSYCLLLADEGSADAETRLQAMVASDDGIALAELGRELGGPGDFFGALSSGLSDQIAADLDVVIADLEAYPALLLDRRSAALPNIAAAITRLTAQYTEPEGSSSRVPSIQIIDNRVVLDSLLALSSSEFENAVARLLPRLGYRDVRRTGGAGDLGADVVCYDEHGRLVIVQCKKYAPGNNVTSPNIQQFFGMMAHHGARHGIYVTTSSFTKNAFDLAAARDIQSIDGTELVALFGTHPDVLGIAPSRSAHQRSVPPAIHENRPETRFPEPSLPVVVPDFYSNRPASAAQDFAAEAEEREWLLQLPPETPVITRHLSQQVSALTEEQQREWRNTRERLLALTPEQFRKACVLSHVALWEGRDAPTIRLLENENASIRDFVVMHREQFLQPSISRCHLLPAKHVVTFEQVHEVIQLAGANGWEAGPYWTTGLFSAGALIRAYHWDGAAANDGWGFALSLLPDKHHPSKGKDFIALAQQPGWPTKVFEGTERRSLIRKLFRGR